MRAVSNAPGDAKISNPTMTAAGGFQALASYIFGKNGASTKMAMTTPVLTTETEMSFVLPKQFWQGDATAPDPVDDSVRLYRRGGGVLRARVARRGECIGRIAAAEGVSHGTGGDCRVDFKE